LYFISIHEKSKSLKIEVYEREIHLNGKNLIEVFSVLKSKGLTKDESIRIVDEMRKLFNEKNS
jgi:uncharacterized protein YjhX (UPF0386 family)